MKSVTAFVQSRTFVGLTDIKSLPNIGNIDSFLNDRHSNFLTAFFLRSEEEYDGHGSFLYGFGKDDSC